MTPRGSDPPARQPRKWLGVHFECCQVYARVYKSPVREAYEGACPRCGRPVRVGIGPGGSGERFFRAG